MKFSREIFRPGEYGEILEGIILSQREFNALQTSTFYFSAGKLDRMVENYYNAAAS